MQNSIQIISNYYFFIYFSFFYNLKQIKSKLKIPLNLEIAATKEMLNIALRNKPPFICIVPEKRKEVTTEGGLNLNYNKIFLFQIIDKLKMNKSRVSLFIEPNLKDIYESKKLNVDCIEIHTGKLCNLINKNKNYKSELVKIKKAVSYGNKLGLEVHAGHGLTYETVVPIAELPEVVELNIGHFLIGESMFTGLKDAIFKMRELMDKARL